MAANTKSLLREVVNYLAVHNIETWVFGGWAEELQGMIAARAHKDFDLFYFAPDFTVVDEFIKKERIVEILGKHFQHKRAFAYKGVLTELFLIQKDRKGFFTNFWGKQKYYWPNDLQGTVQEMKVITPVALRQYRASYAMINDLRP